MRHHLLRVGPWQTKSVFRIAFRDFRHIFSLADPAGAAYTPHSDHFPIFEPDVKALRCARHLRHTDGNGV